MAAAEPCNSGNHVAKFIREQVIECVSPPDLKISNFLFYFMCAEYTNKIYSDVYNIFLNKQEIFQKGRGRWTINYTCTQSARIDWFENFGYFY